jgi:hypothetical protein
MTISAGRFAALGAFAPNSAVNVYSVGTVTPATLYTDKTAGTTAPNPVTADEDGTVNFFAAAGDVDLVYDFGTLSIRTTVTVWPDPTIAWPG